MTTKPQAGILNRPPEHAMLAAYNLTTLDPASTLAAVERLREVVRKELKSDLDGPNPPELLDQPSAETGELGFDDGYDRYHLTITVAFGAGAFAKLASSQPPADLIAIPWAQLGDQPRAANDNGDVLLQVCSDSLYITEHVLRRVEQELNDVLESVWVVAGHQRHNSRSGRASRGEGRALIGFLDGTSNLRPGANPDDAKLVFVDPDAVPNYPPPVVETAGAPNPYGGPQPPILPGDLRPRPASEPEWTRGGSYVVVRASTFNASAWDARSQRDQELAVGRHKVSGQPLDAADDASAPDVAEPQFGSGNDPEGAITPLASHVRKSNPRGPGDELRRIFRRGYPLITATGTGELQRGLIFIAFARSISTQFEFITRAWTNNPDFPRPGAGIDRLREIETVLCGGYFFAPPLTKANKPWSFALPPIA